MWQPPSSWCISFDRIFFLAFKLLVRGEKKKPWIGHYPQSVYLIWYCWPKISTQDWILQCAPRLTLPIRQHNCWYPPRVERYLLPRSAELYLYSRLLPVARCWTCNWLYGSAQSKEGRQSLPFQPAKSSVPAPTSIGLRLICLAISASLCALSLVWTLHSLVPPISATKAIGGPEVLCTGPWTKYQVPTPSLWKQLVISLYTMWANHKNKLLLDLS